MIHNFRSYLHSGSQALQRCFTIRLRDIDRFKKALCVRRTNPPRAVKERRKRVYKRLSPRDPWPLWLICGVAVFAVMTGVLVPSVAVLAGVAPLSHVNSAPLKAQTRSPIPSPSYKKTCENKAASEAAMVRCVGSQIAQLNGEIRSALVVGTEYLGRSGVTSTESRWREFMKSECALEEHPYSGGSI